MANCSFNRSTYAIPGSACYMNSQMVGEKDAIAVVRVVASILSIIGTSSVVFLVITKRKACSAKIQPIFVLCIADCLLATMWIVGSAVWLKAPPVALGGWCIAILTLTVAFELVAVNMTLMYALIAHAVYSHQGSAAGLMGGFKEDISVWRLSKAGLMYGFVWFEPLLVVFGMLGVFESTTGILEQAKDCSCWCAPFYGNVIPLPPIFTFPISPTNAATNNYILSLKKLILSISLVIGIHYLVVFVLLAAIYVRILFLVRAEHIKRHIAIQSSDCNLQYGTLAVARGDAAVPKTILLFLTIFVVTGATNFVLSLCSVVVTSDSQVHHMSLQRSKPFLVLSLLQSLVLPLQGFLNAIVYGWTNEDFAGALMRSDGRTDAVPSRQSHNAQGDRRELLYSEEISESG